MMTITEEERNKALMPVWEGDRVYRESVMFLENEETVRLLYPAIEIEEVTSSDRKTVYTRGRDWELSEGCFVRLKDSSIPFVPLSAYYPTEHIEGQSFGCTVEGHPYLAYGENDTFIKYQIDITYRHTAPWIYPNPKGQRTTLHRFFDKLTRGEEVTVVFYGDSITTGCNSSGTFGRGPNLPSFPYLIALQLAEEFGYRVSFEVDPHIDPATAPEPLHGSHVMHYINTAVGGMESNWGLQNAHERVGKYHPDLFFLAFGMNDGWKSKEEFLSLTKSIVDAVRSDAPNTDVCLIATMLPHFRAAGFYANQEQYEDVLETYASGEEGIIVAPMTTMHKALLDRKEYYTMTGNNINHCNDFLARVYAMTVLAVLK